MLYEDLTIYKTPELLGLPPAKWLMEGIIPEEGFVGLYGQPGTGKSFIALDWAMCISKGIPWLGHSTQQRPVIYVAAEGGRGIQTRVREWMRYHQIPKLDAMYWMLNPLYVREEGTVEAFLEKLDYTYEEDLWPGLIVLDTLSRSFGGGEENASADMGHFVDQVTKLAQGRRMAALIVHHMNAMGQRERGSTAFRGAADAMWGCFAERDRDGKILRVELKNDKQKDAAETPSIWVRPIEGLKSLVFEETNPPERKEKGQGIPQSMRKVDMLTLLGTHENGLTFTEWRLASGIEKRKFSRRVKQLLNESDIYRDENRYYVTPSNTDLAELGSDDDA